MKIFLVFLNLVFAKPHVSEQPAGRHQKALAPCTFEWLTDKCRIFTDSEKDHFEMPDGTVIWNPVPKAIGSMKRNAGERVQNEKDLTARIGTLHNELLKNLREKSEAMENVLNQHDKNHQKLEIGVKKILAGNPDMYHFIFSPEKQGESISLPMPLENPTGDESMLCSEAKKKLEQALGPKASMAMLALSKQSRDLIETFESEKRDIEIPRYQPTKEFREQRAKRVKELFELARKYAIEVIEQGKTPEQLTPVQKGAIHRLQIITFAGEDTEESKDNPFCKGGPNGYYDPFEHRFTICGGMGNQPDAELIAIMGHEITHSIDPCSSQFELATVNKTFLDTLVGPGGIPIKSAQISDAHVGLIKNLFRAKENAGATRYVGGPLALNASPDAIAFLKSKKVLETISDATTPDDYVLKDIFDCFRQEKGGGFKAQDAGQVEKIANEVATYRTTRFKKNFGNEFRTITDALSKYPECAVRDESQLPLHSQMAEAVCDWMGRKVQGSFFRASLKGKKLDKPLERLSVLGTLAAGACIENAEQQLRPNKTTGEVIMGVKRDRLRMLDEHPDPKKRIEEIFLKDKDVRETLGCPAEPSVCELGVKK